MKVLQVEKYQTQITSFILVERGKKKCFQLYKVSYFPIPFSHILTLLMSKNWGNITSNVNDCLVRHKLLDNEQFEIKYIEVCYLFATYSQLNIFVL